jgi:hypothetical protein
VRFQVLTATILKMNVFWVVTSRSLVNFYQTTQRNNPEDSHLPSSIVLIEELILPGAEIPSLLRIWKFNYRVHGKPATGPS